MNLRLPTAHSEALHALFAPTKHFMLGFRAARYVPGRFLRFYLPIAPHGPDGPKVGLALTFRKRGGRLTGIEADRGWLAGRSGFSTAWRRIGVVVHLLSQPGVIDGEWRADLCDHVYEPGPLLGFCSNQPDTLLVPDRGFFESNGYARQRRKALTATAFDERDSTIVWRGSPTGFGEVVSASMQPTNADLVQRVRMCLLLARADPRLRVDVRCVAGRSIPSDVATILRQAGIIGDRVPEDSWVGRQFAIDIDGHANAFSNLFIRLLYGCCVIKVASPLGFRQWYYDRLVPWQHYVPVAADLSDLVERIEWCRSNPDECRSIAKAGQALAMGMTRAAEITRAVARIGARPWAPVLP